MEIIMGIITFITFCCYVIVCAVGGILTVAVMIKLLVDYLDKREYLLQNSKEEK